MRLQLLIGTYYLSYSVSTWVAHQFQAGILGVARLHWLQKRALGLRNLTWIILLLFIVTGWGLGLLLYYTSLTVDLGGAPLALSLPDSSPSLSLPPSLPG